MRCHDPHAERANDLGPQPGLSGIATLTDQLSHTGADVTLTMTNLPDDVSASVALAAYRIIQESLTNIIKHAGSGPVVGVLVERDGPDLVIEVTNSVATARPGLPTSGFGIAGMQERAHLLGGTLTAGPQRSDRYVVRARLPLEFEPT